MDQITGLERKFQQFDETLKVTDGTVIEGYASLFDKTDQGGDVVAPGAYQRSLAAIEDEGRRVKMLWQHDPAQPIGVWDEVREEDKGLYVKGRLLTEIKRGKEAATLVEAGAIDGLSIGYKTVRAKRDAGGQRRLADLELWEVSLVTFPMLSDARVGTKGETQAADAMRELAQVFQEARQMLGRF
jgi:HK97 family phage prohead protease